MTTMSVNQVIHAAVRRDVGRTEHALRSLRDGDRPRARQVQRAWENLVNELTHHHESEDALIWPFLLSHGVDAGLMRAMEDEHVAMKQALSEVSRAIDTVVADPTQERARAAADVVARSRKVVDAHLEHEERAVEPLLAGHEDDPEWKAVAKRLRPQRISDTGHALAWMQDGAGERERAGLRQTIPAPVLAVITTVFGRRYRREVAPTWRTSAG
jgi:hemerythrin-like domain-containing protein